MEETAARESQQGQVSLRGNKSEPEAEETAGPGTDVRLWRRDMLVET